MQLIRIYAALLATILALASNPAFANQQIKQIDAPAGPWTHEPTGTILPDQIAGFKRDLITEFTDDHTNASVRYMVKNSDGEMLLSIYLYPAIEDIDCPTMFSGVTEPILSYPGATLASTSEAPIPWSDSGATALYARFHIPENAMIEGYPASVSDALLYCPENTDWLVKYRATWFGPDNKIPSIKPVLDEIKWPDFLK